MLDVTKATSFIRKFPYFMYMYDSYYHFFTIKRQQSI